MIVKALKALWLCISFLVIITTLYSFDGKAYSDIWVFLTWSMQFISFPAGLFVSLFHSLLGQFFSTTIETSYFSLSVEWGVYCALGYYQWFILVPYLYKRLTNKFNDNG